MSLNTFELKSFELGLNCCLSVQPAGSASAGLLLSLIVHLPVRRMLLRHALRSHARCILAPM
jgi:hypothetical protein